MTMKAVQTVLLVMLLKSAFAIVTWVATLATVRQRRNDEPVTA